MLPKIFSKFKKLNLMLVIMLFSLVSAILLWGATFMVLRGRPYADSQIDALALQICSSSKYMILLSAVGGLLATFLYVIEKPDDPEKAKSKKIQQEKDVAYVEAVLGYSNEPKKIDINILRLKEILWLLFGVGFITLIAKYIKIIFPWRALCIISLLSYCITIFYPSIRKKIGKYVFWLIFVPIFIPGQIGNMLHTLAMGILFGIVSCGAFDQKKTNQ